MSKPFFPAGHSLDRVLSTPATTSDVPLSASSVRVVALCALVTLIEGIDLTLIPLLGPRIMTAWNATAGEFGIILSSGPIGLIAGGLGVGFLADRIGRRNALIVAMVLMTAATFVTMFAQNVPQMLICRLVTGISFGGVIPVSVALVSESAAARVRASGVAFVFLGQAGGGLLAALLVKMPGLSDGPWQTPVLYVGCGCALVTLLLFAALPESPRYLNLRERNNRLSDLFTEGRAVGTSLLWATFIGVCVAVSFFTNWLTTIITHAGKPVSVGVDAIAWYSAGAMVGGLVLPLFTRIWRTNMVLLGSIVFAVASCIAVGLSLSSSDTVILIVAAISGVFVSGAFFMLYPPAAKFYPTHIRSTGIGAAVAFGRIGNMLSPAAAGFMLQAGVAPATVFYAIAAPMVLSCVALVAFDRLTATSESIETQD
jgi:AAHS family 3-hydroxyphenylpropionic acid transporter